jgi:hypothetical protein
MLTKLGISTTSARDVRAAAHERARHHARAEQRGTRPRRTRRSATAPCRNTAPVRLTMTRFAFDPERQQHRLLDPLVDLPAEVGRLGDTQGSRFQSRQHGINCRAHTRGDLVGVKRRPPLECRIDAILQRAHIVQFIQIHRKGASS